ncbi:hypothetical protein [uncultured Bacteroides sp.]|uniref:hypothetical protein n=1 Tax=uncultured Bacteroides sp. TaxID=162156 RepID=UPI002AABD392|nr:hypothetical protein [uncultured Bacteroides sp.]
MSNLTTSLLKAAHQFSIVDFGAFKICLLSMGILLGTYFSNFFSANISIIWIIAIITWSFMLFQVIKYMQKS